MSKNVAVFVDVANLYYAARGQDVDVDYVALLKHATKGRDLIRAYAYSGLDPENENQKKFLDFLGKNGYKVVAKDIRKFGDGRVKANLDIELVVDLFRLASRMDIAVIVSGDGDFAPAIRALQDEGVRCEVISFKPNTSSDLFAVADEFVDVMKISAIGREKGAKGVGAPEMPAKEVNPDVGFREASPSVAAAALAAIRGDGEEPTTATRGRGRASGSRRSERSSRTPRGRTRSIDAAAASGERDGGAESTARPASEATEGESARRRRRRGGRGRGRRGRRGEAIETSPSGTGLESVGWQEVDSLEDLDEAGLPGGDLDRSYEFEEADAATLAELGLSGQPTAVDAAVTADAAPVTETAATPSDAKPRGRSRRASSKAAADTADASSVGPAEKPARSRSRKPAPAGAEDAATGTGTKRTRAAATKATSSQSRASKGRKPKAAAGAPTDAAQAETAGDEGIWKRFTSGRSRRKPADTEGPNEN